MLRHFRTRVDTNPAPRAPRACFARVAAAWAGPASLIRTACLGVVTACAPVTVACAACSDQEAAVRVPPVIRLDRTLTEARLRVAGFEDEALVIQDERGRSSRVPLGAVLALVFESEPTALTATPWAPPPPAGPSAWLMTTDGRRYSGALDSAPPDGTGARAEPPVHWRLEDGATITCSLDEILSIRLRPGLTDLLASERDLVVLDNGDRLSGIIESIGPGVRIEIGGKVRALEPGAIAGIVLANPPVAARTPLVWLRDGRVLGVKSVRGSILGRVLLELPGGTEIAVAGSDVRAIVFDGARVRPLAALKPAAQTGLGERRWTPPLDIRTGDPDEAPAPLNAPDIEIPGPMTVRWALPAEAVRFAAIAELALDARAWGDCDVVLEVQGRELARERLHAGRVTVELNAALPGGSGRTPRTLEIRVEPGQYGVIQDHVVLRRALLLLEPAAAPRR